MNRNKSVDLTGVSVRPLPKELFDTVLCTNCQKRAARWEFAEGVQPASSFSCSICFLYEAPPLKIQRIQLDLLIDQVEKVVPVVFNRDEQLRLTQPEDADRIAFGIVMTQRFMQARSSRGGFSA